MGSILRKPTLVSSSGIFALAFAVRAILWARSAPHRVFNHVEVVQTAMCFARHGFLGNPFFLPTGPTAHVTPAFPFLIGLLYRYAPNLSTGEHWKSLATIAITSLQFALLPALACAARLTVKAGIVAGLIGACAPMLYLECSGDFETPLVALAVVLIAAITLPLCETGSGTSFWSGILWGVSSLISAQLLLCGFVYGLVKRLRVKHPWRIRIQSLVLFGVGLILAILPWTIRNWIELGAPVISRDNAGLELYVSNSDDSAVTFAQNLKNGMFVLHHPHGSATEALLVKQMGEIRYNKLKEKEALGWIRQHPGTFVKLTAERFFSFWFLPEAPANERLYSRFILIVGFVGLFLCARRREGNLLFFAALFALYPLPHYLIETSDRYRYPLNPALLLFTGYFIVWAIALLKRRANNEAISA